MRRSLWIPIAPLLLLGFLSWFMSEPGLTASRGSTAEGVSEKKIKSLIEDLKSDRFERREAAAQALMELEDEPPELQEATKSPDLELRQRAFRIHKAFAQKRARRGLAKTLILAKEGRIDETIERLVLWKDSDKGQGWKALTELVGKVAEEVERTYGKTHFQWLLKPIKADTKETIVPKKLAEYWQATSKIVRGDKITFDRKRGRGVGEIIIACGNVQTISSSSGIIAASGNVHLSATHSSVIICGGDCEVDGEVSESLIIARGKVTCPRGVNYSVIISEDFVVTPKPFTLYHSAILNGGPNRLVKFFDPADVGLLARAFIDEKGGLVPDGGTWIVEAREGTPFASGLRARDVVTAIDELRTPSIEVFRKVLRKKLAEGGPTITFTVRRAGKTLDVPVAVKD